MDRARVNRGGSAAVSVREKLGAAVVEFVGGGRG
jgi:hypothetical protein